MCLPHLRREDFVDRTAIVAGWGFNETVERNQRHLHKVHVAVHDFDNKRCKQQAIEM